MISARLPVLTVDETFALPPQAYVFLIGGGGKTTLMFAMAHHLSRAGRTVVSTTSTRILYPSPSESARVIVEDDPRRLVSRLASELADVRHVTVAKSVCEKASVDPSRDRERADRKLGGYTPDELDYLWQGGVADYLLVEADGAAGRSLKAHLDHEPVVSSRADLVIAVIGCDCVGCLLNDAHVYRSEQFGRLLNRPLGTPVTVDDVAAIFFHPRGYLRAVPPEPTVMVLISKAGGEARRANAERLAAALWAADGGKRMARVVIGELGGPQPFLELAGRA